MKLHEVVVNGSKTGTKYFASLYVDAWKVGIIELKGRQPLKHFLCTLQKPYIIIGLAPTGFRCLRVSTNVLLESTSFL